MKLRQCFGKHEYMNRSLKFSAVYIWNTLLDLINTNSSYYTLIIHYFLISVANSAMPEVRGTAEFHGGAYHPCHMPPRTYSRLSSLFRCGPTG